MNSMRTPIEVLASYLHLAQAAKRRSQRLVRDRVLLLAGVIAAQIDLLPIAAACREQILASNPRHLVGRWRTIGAALNHEDFQSLVAQLSTRYSPERVEALVQRLGFGKKIDAEKIGAEKFDPAAFASEGEYAAALLGLDWHEILRRFGHGSDD
jgi:hypothetical protein